MQGARRRDASGLTFDRLTIDGGRPLTGRVDVEGAKNLVTKAMVASLLGETVQHAARRARHQRRRASCAACSRCTASR